MTALYPWQTALYQQLTHAFLQGRGHHALLFKTDEGLGTEQLIRRFAEWLLCQHPQGETACGECKSCLLAQAGNHPDFHLLASIDNKDIGVDQVREIGEKLQQFAQQGGNAVVYLKGAERLTEAASNAILKTLEEPHQNVYFLLEAPLSGTMLPTIQSRCQLWLVKPPTLEQAGAWLQAQCPEATLDELEVALRLCHFRPLHSQTFLNSHRLLARRQFLQDFWRFYKSRDVFLLFSAFEKEDKTLLFQQLEWLDSFVGDALKSKLGVSSGWINPDLQAGIVPFSQSLTAEKLLTGHQLIQQTRQDIAEVNAVNVELMLLNLLTGFVLNVFE